MKQALRVAASAFAATFALTAIAQTTVPGPAPVPAPAPEPASGIRSSLGSVWGYVAGGAPYLGVGVGSASTSGISGSSNGVTVTGDAAKVSGKVLGGLQFTPYVGLEAQYANVGSRSVTAAFGSVSGSGSTTADQWSVAGTGTVPLGERFSLFGKLGVSRNHMGGTSFCVSAYCSAFAGSQTDVLWGVGFNYSLNKHISIRGEYEDFGKFSANGGANGGIALTGASLGGSVRADNWALDLIFTF